MSKTPISERIWADGAVAEMRDGGAERRFPGRPMREMTESEISAAAADPDARPMTPEPLASAARVPRIKTLRRALGLPQEEFATRNHIPQGALRDWEQGRSAPDQPARAYLKVIAADPKACRAVWLRTPAEAGAALCSQA